MNRRWSDPRTGSIEELARKLRTGIGILSIFEAVPDSFMTEIAVYGLAGAHAALVFRRPLHLPAACNGTWATRACSKWCSPAIRAARTSPSNGLADNVLVTAHVLGHADFSHNNLLFRRCQEQVSEHIVEHAASHARQISQAIESHGMQRVEAALDAALALEQHVDIDQPLRRARYPEYLEDPKVLVDDEFRKRFAALEPAAAGSAVEAKKRAPVPPHPERDLLWFVANYAPEMESWERDIFLAVREESFYFYPVFATQIMNEGWASYWHARLLREADFIPQQAYLDAIKCHSDVVRPVAAEQQVSLSINPYHLGFAMWEKIVAKATGSRPRATSWSRTMTSASCAIT